MQKLTENNLSTCGALARKHDYERYFCCLFAAPEQREALFSLLAFNFEIARIAEYVSEPMVGYIRLAWWRDALQEIAEGKAPRKHEVVVALSQSISNFRLPIDMLQQMVEAREADLEKMNPANLTALEEYARKTAGLLNRLMAIICGMESEEGLKSAENLGAAWAVLGLARAVAYHAEQGRSYLPEDLISEANTDKPISQLSIEELDKIAPVIRKIITHSDVLFEEVRKQYLKHRWSKSFPVFAQAVIAKTFLSQVQQKNCSISEIGSIGLSTPLKLKIVIKSMLKSV